MKSIEEWLQLKGTSNAVFEGIKAAQGWRTGKQVNEQEYDLAVEHFLKAPISGGGTGVQ